ncbi:hypothetical protein NPIL_641981, partial [Nephila pilipes]
MWLTTVHSIDSAVSEKMVWVKNREGAARKPSKIDLERRGVQTIRKREE